MPTLTYTQEEWLALHGGNPIQVDERVALLPDGAAIRHDGMGHVRHDPPTDEVARLQLRTQYHSRCVEVGTRDFADLKRALLGQSNDTGGAWVPPFAWGPQVAARYGPPPQITAADPYGKEGLLRIKQYVQLHREALADVQRQLDELTGPTPEQRRMQQEEAQRLRQSEAEAAYRAARERQEIEAMSLEE